jgi:curved DNA-binding protein CbpA
MAERAQNHYDVLDVPRDAPAEIIKAAYRALARISHPDTNERFDAEERFRRINEAYEILSDPVRRAEYDRQLKAAAPAAGADEEPEAFDIRVDPQTIDFGILKNGGQNVNAEVVLSWAGGPPYLIRRSPSGGDWWNIQYAAPETDRVTFTVSAQAYAGLQNGRHKSRFDIVVDDIAYGVELAMTARQSFVRTGRAIFIYRTSWLLATVAAFLYSAYVENLINPSNYPPAVFVALAGTWNLAIIIYGLRRTFRRRRNIVISSSKKLWVYSCLAVIVFIGSILLWKYNNGPPAQS